MKINFKNKNVLLRKVFVKEENIHRFYNLLKLESDFIGFFESINKKYKGYKEDSKNGVTFCFTRY